MVPTELIRVASTVPNSPPSTWFMAASQPNRFSPSASGVTTNCRMTGQDQESCRVTGRLATKGPPVGRRLNSRISCANRVWSIGQRPDVRKTSWDRTPIGLHILQARVRGQKQRQSLGGHDFGEPLQRRLSKLFVALRQFEILGEPVQQADFFIGRRDVLRKASRLAKQLGDPSVARQTLDGHVGHLAEHLRGPRLLATRPGGNLVRRHVQ